MLWILPLEPLEERYTEQWYRWFAQSCEEMSIPYTYLDGEKLTETVETGVVLDAHGTNYWKFTQLQKVCQIFKEGQVKDGDAFFTMDLWHPGLEAIPYMATLSGIDADIYGFLHAGSYTREDFASPMAPWAQYFEPGWAKFCKGVFVGTRYHREKFLDLRDVKNDLGKKVFVTGNPWNTQEALSIVDAPTAVRHRENIIIYPHRWDVEKRPDVFVDMMERLWETRQDFRVVITTSRPHFRSNDPLLLKKLSQATFPYKVKANLTKAKYYTELSKAKVFVSTTIEENFGYCAVEAMTFGVIPTLPNAYSHPELVAGDDKFLYNTLQEGIDKVCMFLDNPPDSVPSMVKYDDSIGRMLSIIQRSGSIAIDPTTFRYLWHNTGDLNETFEEIVYGWNK